MYLHIVLVNAFSLLFHIYNDESVGNDFFEDINMASDCIMSF